MHTIPFFIGNTLACMVRGSERRSRFRGNVNMILFRPWIARFIKREYGEKLKTLRFVHQRTLNRVVGVVNDKYYVKIFRNVTNEQIRNFVFLMDYIRPYMHVEIPHIIADRKLPMYVCKKNTGRDIDSFEWHFVLNHEKHIFDQVSKVISQLQSIDVEKIPDNERFLTNMQHRRYPELPCKKCRRVLGHFDMNLNNFLYDDNLNIVSAIDWDTLSIADNPQTDWRIFTYFWEHYKGVNSSLKSV